MSYWTTHLTQVVPCMQAQVVDVPNAQWLLLVADNRAQSPPWLWPVVAGIIFGSLIFGALAMSTMVSRRQQQNALDVTLVRVTSDEKGEGLAFLDIWNEIIKGV